MMNLTELEKTLEEIIEAFEQELIFKETFSEYGLGARDAYDDALDLIRSSASKESDI